jgi:hypothetical protein
VVVRTALDSPPSRAYHPRTMNTSIRLSLAATAAVGCVAVLWAASPPGQVTSLGAGKVLVLTNERTLEGDIDKVGDAYRVRRQAGEVSVPAVQVLHLCTSMEEAYAYVRGRANLRDPDERLRLAQWCHVRGLKDQAVVEVTAAAELRPDHGPTQRLLTHLQQSAATPRGPEPAVTSEPEPPGSSVDLSNESLCAFSTKVQPVLMNACANCHATGKGGAFKLTRTYPDAPVSNRAVQQNLTAVLAQLNLQQLEGSPLLTKAVSAHGSLNQSPLKGRQAQAFRLLEDWVKRTVDANPRLRAQATPPPAPPLLPAADKPAPELAAAKDEKKPVSSFGEAKAVDQPPPGPVDPFDPSVFNRQMHPPR